MDTQSKKILITHPGKQYVHHLLKALEVYNINYVFYTSFLYNPKKFPFTLIALLPKFIRTKVEKELKKRAFSELDNSKIFQYPWFEILREIGDKFLSENTKDELLYKRNIIHDKWVAKKLKHINPYMVIGYEESSYYTFKKARELGITTVLDLAQIHYKEIENISNTFPFFKKAFANTSLRKKINFIKENELKNTDYIICLSSFAEESLLKNGFDKNRIFIANLGADTSKFIPKKEYNNESTLKLIFVGTLFRRKGVDILLEAVKQLHKNIHLYLIGPMGDSESDLKKYEGEFTRVSFVHHEELNNYLNKADVFVLPSYLDSWGMVVTEAMACGLPVIVTNNTGAKDAVNKNCGIIIPTGDINALKDSIMFFYQNREKLEQMGRQAAIEALKFGWEHYHAQIQVILNKISNTLGNREL